MLSVASPIIFLRHGETPWNALGRYQGATDTNLSAKGKLQARENAQQINKFIQVENIDPSQLAIISSPLSRARQTADIILNELNLKDPLIITPEFRELSMGRWEGLTSQQVKDQFYKERKSRKINRWNFKPVGGESMAGRSGEIKSALTALKPYSIVVTHSVVLRTILYLLGGINKEIAAQAVFPHAGLVYWDSALLHRQN